MGSLPPQTVSGPVERDPVEYRRPPRPHRSHRRRRGHDLKVADRFTTISVSIASAAPLLVFSVCLLQTLPSMSAGRLLLGCCVCLVGGAACSDPVRVSDAGTEGHPDASGDVDSGGPNLDGTMDEPMDVDADGPSDVIRGSPVDRQDDAISWDAAVECGSLTCGAEQLCIRFISGVDARDSGTDAEADSGVPPGEFYCAPVPQECAANPTCECIQQYPKASPLCLSLYYWCFQGLPVGRYFNCAGA